jgi:uncharacterized OB-fold protein
MVRTRPHTQFVQQLKTRRCGKCGALLHPQRKRCKRCAALVSRPKKKPAKAHHRVAKH